MTSVAPASGATITVRDCETQLGTGWARLCSHDFRGAFNVQANGELQYLVLTVSFWDGERRCGYAADTLDVLAAETSASLAPSIAFLSWEEYSPPPVKTVQAVADMKGPRITRIGSVGFKGQLGERF